MRGRLGLTAGLLTLATGCGLGFGAVDVDEHVPLPGTTRPCTSLVDAAPEVVSDAVRRDVEPPSPGVAAWGDPPIILRCGVPEPVVDPTSNVFDVAGVTWVPVSGEGGTYFYTVGRTAVLEVAIPDDYAPEAEVLVDLAPAVVLTVEKVSEAPTGG